MVHPLQKKIVALRRRVRRMTVLHGLCLAVAVFLGAIVLVGSIDYLFRFQDRGLRVIASLTAVGAFAWICRRYVLRALRMRTDDTNLAQRVERRFPSLGDRLVTAVDFLHQADDDPAAGSAVLRQAVVAQATAETERLDFSEVLDPRPTVRAVLVLMAVCVAAGGLVALNPLNSRIAVARLADPFGNTAWPQATRLTIRQPVVRVARGRDFQIEVVDSQGARLPADVRIHYRFVEPDGSAVEETEPMRPVDGVMTARRENVVRPFSYRVTGGDDRSMPWIDVQVVEPPTLDVISVRLIPPAYTGWSPTPAQRQIRALVGSRVQITAKAAKPLRSATLCVPDERIPAQLSADGRSLTAKFTVEKSGSYWFDLIDREGLTGGDDDRWEIRAIPDAPPAVTIEQPTANLHVTPQAAVPVRVAARDDLALQSIGIVYRRVESEPEAALPIWIGPERPPPSDAAPAVDASSFQGDRRVVDVRWDLGPLALKPGMDVTFHATAADYLSQTGDSEPRSLRVVTTEELRDRVFGHEKLILAELARALKLQRGCRAQVESLQARLAESQPIDQATVDRLQVVQHNQREADQILTSRTEGVTMHVLTLLADLENNRLQGDELQQRMLALSREIARLGREHLPEIGRELTAAVKTGQVTLQRQTTAARPDPRIAASLAAARRRQDAVIASIERMTGQLARWDDYRRFPREIGRLLRDQQDVAHRTSEVGRRTLAQALRDLPPQDVADLKTAAGRQLELARLLDRLLQGMDLAAIGLRQNDPSAANTVADALQLARRLGASGHMRTAGQRIRQNQIGQAVAGQKQIAEDLQQVLDVFANRDRQEGGPSQSESTASPAPGAESEPTAGHTDGRQDADRSADAASPGIPEATKTQAPDASDVRALMQRLWGELPEQARQQMQQFSIERFPPKYESLIQEYYRRLAEEKTENKR